MESGYSLHSMGSAFPALRRYGAVEPESVPAAARV